MMAEKIGFSDPEDDSLCFGLCECVDGANIQRPLAPDREVLSVMETWFDKPAAKFVFQLKLYTEQLVNSKDPKVVNMMFIQVRGGGGRAARAHQPRAHPPPPSPRPSTTSSRASTPRRRRTSCRSRRCSFRQSLAASTRSRTGRGF